MFLDNAKVGLIFTEDSYIKQIANPALFISLEIF